jgi:hydrogenase-4 membrane subunit HyfE
MIEEAVVLLAGAALVLFGRSWAVVCAYVVLAGLATFVSLPASTSLLAGALLMLSAVLKLVIAPLGVWFFVRANPEARDLRPSVGIPLRLLAIIVFALAARHAGAIPPLGAYVILCALGMLVVQRSLIAHILGLLALGAGVSISASALGPGLPESIELGATFDVLVVTFIGLAIARAFIVHNPLLDVESLRRLRG